VFIYAHDPTDPQKQSRAVSLVARLAGAGSLVVSAQVLNEFYARATRPTTPPSLSHEQAAAIVVDIAASATVLPLTLATTVRALQGRADYGLSWWDALLWATARENGITLIYTEDLPGMLEIDGVRYVNPFADASVDG
jgi:predicted nucleic acid-binding protein